MLLDKRKRKHLEYYIFLAKYIIINTKLLFYIHQKSVKWFQLYYTKQFLCFTSTSVLYTNKNLTRI